MIFRHLLVLGRPACGKSEFIDFLKHAPDEMRRTRLHIGRFEEVDDFPWLWEKFQDDEIWEQAGYERLYTEEYMPGNPGMAPKGAKLFDWCMHKFNEVIGRQYVGRDDFYRDSTLLVEFSRGGADGFRRALGMLDRAVLEPAAIFYIHVSREESWRRNVARYQEKLRHSILAHMVPRQTYDYFYDVNDWDELTGGKAAGWIDIETGGRRQAVTTGTRRTQTVDRRTPVGNRDLVDEHVDRRSTVYEGDTSATGSGLRTADVGRRTSSIVRVPFVTMSNEPESTDPAVLEERYSAALGELWNLRQQQPCSQEKMPAEGLAKRP